MNDGNIYLTGFMGSGKTTIGKLMAKTLNREFIDMDSVLEREFGIPIPEVFERYGEKTFRDRETGLLSELSGGERRVIATGGGVPENERNRMLMSKSGTIVFLDSDLDTCSARLSGKSRSKRPLWQNMDAVRSLFERRRPSYKKDAFAVEITGHDRVANARMVISALFEDERFPITLESKERPVSCVWDGPAALAQEIRDRQVVILTDRTVGRLHLKRYLAVLNEPLAVELQPGERTKSLNGAKRLYEALLKGRFDRGALLVALGGGMITDLGAFVASTYKRGMGFILVSTSLVGCVDAAVGGKAAVNFGPAKNVIGCFTIPEAVILDLPALSTLKRSHVSEGLVEAYKTGLIANRELADLIEKEAETLLQGDVPLLARVASLSARTKADVVSQDFRESGLRRILNFGHTYGHAVEGFNNFKVSHGQSVALGMIAAMGLSRNRDLVSKETMSRVVETIERIAPFKGRVPTIDEAWELMLQDKKIVGGRMIFVLLEGVGKPVCVDDVSRKELEAAILYAQGVCSG